jgi:ankyrin repeat protein
VIVNGQVTLHYLVKHFPNKVAEYLNQFFPSGSSDMLFKLDDNNKTPLEYAAANWPILSLMLPVACANKPGMASAQGFTASILQSHIHALNPSSAHNALIDALESKRRLSPAVAAGVCLLLFHPLILFVDL